MEFLKRTSVWIGVCILLLALGACANRPEAPVEAESVAETEQLDGAVDAMDSAEEYVAGKLETEADETTAGAESADGVGLVPAVEDWTQRFVVEGQYIYVGNPKAPVTILDVSDFL